MTGIPPIIASKIQESAAEREGVQISRFQVVGAAPTVGLAKRLEDSDGITIMGDVLGIASCMPPEQTAGQIDSIGPRSDVYALGANLGRQHWPSCYAAILAGGGSRGGRVYGESDKHGVYVKDKPVRLQDLRATLFRSLALPLDLRLGRDGFTCHVSTGEPRWDLFCGSWRR